MRVRALDITEIQDKFYISDTLEEIDNKLRSLLEKDLNKENSDAISQMIWIIREMQNRLE